MKRSRGTEDLVKLAHAHEHLARGEDLTADDRAILQSLAFTVMNNDDPRSRFHKPIEGKPSSPHRLFVCLDYLFQPDAETRPKAARDRIAVSWNLKARTVREIVDGLRSDALPLIEHSSNREGLRCVVEVHRQKHLADNSPSSPKT